MIGFDQVLKNLPNFITLARMLMTPLAVSMIVAQRFMPAFLIFIFAGVSDGVDGFIARHYNLRTELGAYLDPLADKALLISIYVSLADLRRPSGLDRDHGGVARRHDSRWRC